MLLVRVRQETFAIVDGSKVAAVNGRDERARAELGWTATAPVASKTLAAARRSTRSAARAFAAA